MQKTAIVYLVSVIYDWSYASTKNTSSSVAVDLNLSAISGADIQDCSKGVGLQSKKKIARDILATPLYY